VGVGAGTSPGLRKPTVKPPMSRGLSVASWMGVDLVMVRGAPTRGAGGIGGAAGRVWRVE